MKNWLQNLLFVLFSFVFLGLGVLIAEILIREKGNPLKDPDFLADAPVDTSTIDTTFLTPIDTTQSWRKKEVPHVVHSISKKNHPKTTIKLSKIKHKPNTNKHISNTKAYLVITGMFRQKTNMIREIKKLKSLGYTKAYSFQKLSLNAVCAGHFEKNEAQRVAFSLKKKGFQAIVKHQ